MEVRRIVTGHDNGRSVVALEGPAPRAISYKHIPGMGVALVWGTPAVPRLPFDGTDPAPGLASWVPSAGGTRLMVVDFPPDAVFMSPEFDPMGAAEEQSATVPGLAECFEAESPGMHTTATVDYGIVLDGEIWLELDDGVERHLKRGDIIIQNGTRHAWRNKSDVTVTVAFVLIGAER